MISCAVKPDVPKSTVLLEAFQSSSFFTSNKNDIKKKMAVEHCRNDADKEKLSAGRKT
jgi:hypothetical protein